MKIKELIILITGGASGIGKEISKRLLEKGAKMVAILDLNEKAGLETEKELNEKFGPRKTRFIQCDVTNSIQLKESFQTAYDEHKCLNVVINNAGSAKEHISTIAINLVSTIEGSYLAKDFMSKKNGGNGGLIINMSSVSGLFPTFVPIYAASKHGTVGFTMSLPISDLAFSPDDIRVAVLCPFLVQTELGMSFLDSVPDHQKAKFNRETANPIPVSLVADACELIIEDDSIHGKAVRVTPGQGIDFHEYPSRAEVSKKFKYTK